MFAKPNTQKVAVMDYEKSNDRKEDENVSGENESTETKTSEEKARRYRKDYSEEDQALEEWEKQARAKENGEETDPDPEPKGEDKTWKKRYGDLRRHNNEINAQLRELQEQNEQLQKAAAEKQEFVMPKTQEELAAWAGKNPEIYNLIRSVAINEYRQGHDELQKGMQNLQKAQGEIEAQRAEAILMKLHPDFENIREDDEFHDWMAEQPTNIQDAIYQNRTDAAAASRVIDLYKYEKGITKVKKETSKRDVNDAAKSVTTKGAPKTGGDDRPLYKESEIRDMHPRQYEKEEDKILEAMRSGRVEMDLSGKR